MNFKDSKAGYMEGLEGGQVRKKLGNDFIISKIKERSTKEKWCVLKMYGSDYASHERHRWFRDHKVNLAVIMRPLRLRNFCLDVKKAKNSYSGS